MRILCAREFQNSIAQSVHKLLASQIDALDFGSNFVIQQRSIECISTGSEFIFEGLRFNISKIKSMDVDTEAKADFSNALAAIKALVSQVKTLFEASAASAPTPTA